MTTNIRVFLRKRSGRLSVDRPRPGFRRSRRRACCKCIAFRPCLAHLPRGLLLEYTIQFARYRTSPSRQHCPLDLPREPVTMSMIYGESNCRRTRMLRGWNRNRWTAPFALPKIKILAADRRTGNAARLPPSSASLCLAPPALASTHLASSLLPPPSPTPQTNTAGPS